MKRYRHNRSQAVIDVSWLTLAVCLIGWPATSLTVFRGEPQGVLGLSWVALILSAANTLLTAYVNQNTNGVQDQAGT